MSSQSMVDSGFWHQINNLTDELQQEEKIRALREQYCDASCEQVKTQDVERPEVLGRIEAVVEGVVTAVAQGEPPRLCYSRRDSWESVIFQEDIGLQRRNDGRLTEVRFEVPTSTNKFALMLKVLSLCYRLIQTNTYSTKRDLYYNDVQSFGSQSTVDDIVDNLACMLQVPRRCLHVLATSKGCLYGDLRYTDANGSFIDCSSSKTGTQVPNHVEGITNIQSHAKFVLVVEKDATFQKIIDDGLIDRISQCIIVTGKGFPDVNTRLMVRRLWDSLHIPVLALVDADPHGLAILLVYKFGSLSLSYESHRLTVPTIKWLGVLPSDIKKLRLPERALLPLSPSDMKKASELMRRPFYKDLPEWMFELQEMMQSGHKAEIQCLTAVSESFLTDVYLPSKIRCGGWI